MQLIKCWWYCQRQNQYKPIQIANIQVNLADIHLNSKMSGCHKKVYIYHSVTSKYGVNFKSFYYCVLSRCQFFVGFARCCTINLLRATPDVSSSCHLSNWNVLLFGISYFFYTIIQEVTIAQTTISISNGFIIFCYILCVSWFVSL